MKKAPRSLRSGKIVVSILSLLCCLLAVHTQAQNQTENPPEFNPLFVDPASRDFSRNPPLLDRIKSSPHGYFRFINAQFSSEVCARLEDILHRSSAFNLHGDAHMEQYAITSLGRGMTDFDDSSTGPAVLDLIRFGVSLHLTCLANNWQDYYEELFDDFLFGYRRALEDTSFKPIEPTLSKKIRQGFTSNPKAFYAWADSKMEPIPETDKAELIEAMKPFIEMMHLEDPRRSPGYFQIEKIGALKMGIGSALDLKYLVRFRGNSEKPFDDVIIEIKELRDISGIDCIISCRTTDPFRVLLGSSRIAYQPFKHLGYFFFRDKFFWTHSWVENYKELDVRESFESVEMLREVVADVGAQLGKGHVKHIASPLDVQLRRFQLLFLTKHEQRIKRVCRDLTNLTIAGWEQFKNELMSE